MPASSRMAKLAGMCWCELSLETDVIPSNFPASSNSPVVKRSQWKEMRFSRESVSGQ